MRTLATFRSTAFNTTEARAYFINPDCFGDDLARWLMERLRTNGLQVDPEPGQEDFGWYFCFSVPEGEHCCVLGYRPPDDGESEGVWIAWIERQRGLVASILGRRKHDIAPSALAAIHRALSDGGQIREIRWHRQADFNRGNEGGGAVEPDSG